MHKLNKKGFTLVEILVVILIIGILFVAFLPKIDFAGDKARETGVKSEFRTYTLAFEQLFREHAGFPSDDAKDIVKQLNLLLDPSTRIKANEQGEETEVGEITALAGGTNLKTLAEDPWKKKYEVEFLSGDGTIRKLLIRSYGKKGNPAAPDYIMLTTYINGEIKTCTNGLNNDIGTMDTSLWFCD